MKKKESAPFASPLLAVEFGSDFRIHQTWTLFLLELVAASTGDGFFQHLLSTPKGLGVSPRVCLSSLLREIPGNTCRLLCKCFQENSFISLDLLTGFGSYVWLKEGESSQKPRRFHTAIADYGSRLSSYQVMFC